MSFAFDGTTLRARDGSPGAGIEEYTRQLLDALVAVVGTDVRVVRPIGKIPFVSRHVLLPLVARFAGADMMLCPSGQVPIGWTGKSVIVIHDLAIYEHSEWFPDAPSPLDAKSIDRADKIIAVSEATKAQIGRLFPDALAKTSVVYPGTQLLHMQQLRSSTKTNGEDLVLFVGTLEPRKNLVNAIASFDRFLRMHPDRARTTSFVLAGRMGWKTEPIVDAISATNETWRREAGREVVNHLGYVNEQEKFELYRQASCLLFPSWYEGFGLPVLEAMAAGAPVVTTARGAIAEVAGDAAMYVEPEDTEQMALAVAQCVMMPEAMGEMVAQAKNRAAEFTWERAARQTMEIIKEI